MLEVHLGIPQMVLWSAMIFLSSFLIASMEYDTA